MRGLRRACRSSSCSALGCRSCVNGHCRGPAASTFQTFALDRACLRLGAPGRRWGFRLDPTREDKIPLVCSDICAFTCKAAGSRCYGACRAGGCDATAHRPRNSGYVSASALQRHADAIQARRCECGQQQGSGRVHHLTDAHGQGHGTNAAYFRSRGDGQWSSRRCACPS